MARELDNRYYEGKISDVRTIKVLSTKTSTYPTNSNQQECPIHKLATHLTELQSIFENASLWEKSFQIRLILTKCVQNRFVIIVSEFVPVNFDLLFTNI